MSGLQRWFLTVDRSGLADWIASRPKVVRDLLAEFPIGSQVEVDGEDWFVFGANEGGQLIVAPARCESYDEAMGKRQYLCGEHLRRGEVHWETP